MTFKIPSSHRKVTIYGYFTNMYPNLTETNDHTQHNHFTSISYRLGCILLKYSLWCQAGTLHVMGKINMEDNLFTD